MGRRSAGFTLLELLIVISIIALTTVALFPMIMSMKHSIDLNNTAQAISGAMQTMQSTAFSGSQSRGSSLTETNLVFFDKSQGVVLNFSTPFVYDQTPVYERRFDVFPSKTGPWMITESSKGKQVLQYPVTPIRLGEPIEITAMTSANGQDFTTAFFYVQPFERRIRMMGTTTPPERITVSFGFGKRLRFLEIDLVNGRTRLTHTSN